MHRSIRNAAAFLLALHFAPHRVEAQEVRLSGTIPHPPTIDGKLEEGEWEGAVRLDSFVQVEPGDNSAPSRRTEVFLAADGRSLYVAVHAYDDPALVRATLAPRDGIDADDHVDLHLDTFGDRRRAYLIAFNPLGVQQDGIFVEGTPAPDLTVDLVLRSRGQVTTDGWIVEAAIPFSSLRYQRRGGRTWTLHIQRVIRHLNGEIDSWMPIHRGEAGFLAQAGTLDGLDLPPSRLPIEVIPSVTTLRNDMRGPGAAPGTESFTQGNPESELGVTAALRLAADVTLAGTWNPDFAQVEADAPVVTANQRYPIFYAEKRPFFLEGAELFATPLSVVNTRAIVDPLAALHLTGRQGANGFALLAATDEAPGGQVGSNDRSTIGIARVRRDVGAHSSVGLLASGYTFPDRQNATVGTDASLLGTHFAFRGQLVGTWARREFYDPEQDQAILRAGRGLGYSATLRRTDRHLNLSLSAAGRSPDYLSEVGYTPHPDIHGFGFEGTWNSDRRATGIVRSWSGILSLQQQIDWAGRTHYGYVWPHATFDLPALTTVALGPYLDWQRLYEEEFGPRRNATQAGAFFGAPTRRTLYHGAATTITSAPTAQWQVTTTLDWSWDVFDYDFGAGPRYPRVSPAALADPNAPLDPGVGRTFDATASVSWRPVPAFRTSLDYTKSRLRRDDTDRLAYNEDLWSFTTTYQFTRFTSIRVRGDYRSSYRNFRPQFLLAWAPNPGTAIYAGYNDDLNRNGYSPVTGDYQAGVRRNSRTAYVKVSYLLHAGL